MLRTSSSLVGYVCLLVLVMAMACPVLGQAPAAARPAAAPAGPPLRIKKLEGIGNRAKVETPRYTTTLSRGSKPAGLWHQITCYYEVGRTPVQWIEGLTFRYYVLSVKKDKKKGYAYTLYKTNVQYIDIPAGLRNSDHKSSVFLRPAAVLRYGEVVAIAVEILYNGNVIVEGFDADSKSKGLEGKWWKNPKVVESKVVTVKPGYLLDRSDSPFALINIDDYEVIK